MTKYFLMVFAGGCSYGVLSTIVKLAYHEGYNTAELAFLQALTGLIILAILLLFKSKTPKTGTDPVQWWPLLISGAAIGLTSFVYYLSVQYIPASIAIIILMQFTWIGILLDWLFYKKTPDRDQLLAILLILVGTVMASKLLGSNNLESLSIKGLVLAFGSALFFATYVVLSSKIKTGIPPLKKSVVMMSGSVMVIFTLNAQTLLQTHFDPGIIKWVLLLALFGTIIPPLLFSNGIPKIGVGYSSILMTAELPVAVICAQIILKEQVNLLQWLGIIVILLSIIWLNIKKLKNRSSATSEPGFNELIC